MNVRILVPALKDISMSQVVNEQFLSQDRLCAFNAQAVEFLNQISVALRDSKKIHSYPEMSALSFWLRASHIQQMISEFRKTVPDHVLLQPRGVAFHIAASNVDSNFIYSWALSLLVGNINIVRLSSKQGEQLLFLLAIIRKVLGMKKFKALARTNLLLTYPHSDEITTFLSERCDLRILWGGDATIQNLRSHKTKSSCVDVPFGNKKSFLTVNAPYYLKQSREKQSAAAHAFFNDAYWFEQKACSSPQIVYFIGTGKECKTASLLFWENLGKELKKRRTDSMNFAVEKLIALCETPLQLNPPAQVISAFHHDRATVIRIPLRQSRQLEENPGYGFFAESFAPSLNALKDYVRSDDQTLTYLGFDKTSLSSFLNRVGGRGIDRAVPLGQALNFSSVWDGFSLLSIFGKYVHVE